MSETFSIGCTQCKKHLWIAQAPAHDWSGGYLYYNEKDYPTLYQFLIDHLGHPLIFRESNYFDYGDFEDLSDYGSEE